MGSPFLQHKIEYIENGAENNYLGRTCHEKVEQVYTEESWCTTDKFLFCPSFIWDQFQIGNLD